MGQQNKMKRELTGHLEFIDKCLKVRLEDLPFDDAEQLVICVQLMEEWRHKRDLCQQFLDGQKREIKSILARLKRKPYARDIVVYSDNIERWVGSEYSLLKWPDGILLCSCRHYVQQRLDVMGLKKKAPETYKAYLRKIKCKGKVMTGSEIVPLIFEYYDRDK